MLLVGVKFLPEESKCSCGLISTPRIFPKLAFNTSFPLTEGGLSGFQAALSGRNSRIDQHQSSVNFQTCDRDLGEYRQSQ